MSNLHPRSLRSWVLPGARFHRVFIASTYEDLIEERRQILEALLRIDCLPVGMELWPASPEGIEMLIDKEIDASDYFILLIGRAYGSTPRGVNKSYTELEYERLIERGKRGVILDCRYLREEASESNGGDQRLIRFLDKLGRDDRHIHSISALSEISRAVPEAISGLRRSYPCPGLVPGVQSKLGFVTIGSAVSSAAYVAAFLTLSGSVGVDTLDAERIAGQVFLGSALPVAFVMGLLSRVYGFERSLMYDAKMAGAFYLASGVTGTFLCLLMRGNIESGGAWLAQNIGLIFLFGVLAVFGVFLGYWLGGFDSARKKIYRLFGD